VTDQAPGANRWKQPVKLASQFRLVTRQIESSATIARAIATTAGTKPPAELRPDCEIW
jgi:hypothetical protein